MLEYEKNFLKYAKISNEFSGEFEELLDIVKDNIVDLENDNGDAIVMFGFSGNGKTSWIKNYVMLNQDYKVVSMDKVVHNYRKENGVNPKAEDIIKLFAAALDEVCSKREPVIVDGNFLNLLTRMALCDTLHKYGYKVTLVDLTPQIEKTLASRIMDVATFELNARKIEIEPESLMTMYIKKRKEIMDFYEKEKTNAFYDVQRENDVVGFGVEKVLVVGNDKRKTI